MKSLSNTTQKPDEELTIDELKEELAYLRAENALLKKLEELEQQKRKRAKKKRKCFSSQNTSHVKAFTASCSIAKKCFLLSG